MSEPAVRRITISPLSELAGALKDAEASGGVVIVDTGEAIYPLRVSSLANGSVGITHHKLGAQQLADARAAIMRSAGGWRGIVDAEAFKERLRAERGSSRPPVEL